jgi:hypothetical protein
MSRGAVLRWAHLTQPMGCAHLFACESLFDVARDMLHTDFGGKIVARCANPECNSEFRELSKGRLFLLPPPPEVGESFASVPRIIDHCYWLCPQCANTHTISIRGTANVVSNIIKIDDTCCELDDSPLVTAHLDS